MPMFMMPFRLAVAKAPVLQSLADTQEVQASGDEGNNGHVRKDWPGGAEEKLHVAFESWLVLCLVRVTSHCCRFGFLRWPFLATMSGKIPTREGPSRLCSCALSFAAV